MKKPFTLRIESRLLDDIKIKSVKKGYKNYSDYIEDLLLLGLSLESIYETKEESNSTLEFFIMPDSVQDCITNIFDSKKIFYSE